MVFVHWWVACQRDYITIQRFMTQSYTIIVKFFGQLPEGWKKHPILNSQKWNCRSCLHVAVIKLACEVTTSDASIVFSCLHVQNFYFWLLRAGWFFHPPGSWPKNITMNMIISCFWSTPLGETLFVEKTSRVKISFFVCWPLEVKSERRKLLGRFKGFVVPFRILSSDASI